jgi:hypothetical protein
MPEPDRSRKSITLPLHYDFFCCLLRVVFDSSGSGLHLPSIIACSTAGYTAVLTRCPSRGNSMATVAASHNIRCWEEELEPPTQIHGMSYNQNFHYTLQNVTNALVSHECQPVFNNINTNLPFYSTNTFFSSADETFAYDIPILQPTPYPPNMSSLVSYPQTHNLEPAHAPYDTSSPIIKSEVTSQTQPCMTYAVLSPAIKLERSTSEPTEDGGISSATDVDTLMRAIQAKQAKPSREPEQKVCGLPWRHPTRSR